MNAWNYLYARTLAPRLDPSQAGLTARLRRLRQWETLSTEQVRDRQLAALRSLLRHAYVTCPFYRDRMDAAGLHADRVQGPEDLQRLPPLTRDDLRHQGERIRSSRFSTAELQAASSGGTTDVPVPLWRDRETMRDRHAVQIELQRWAGLRPGDKTFLLWGARSDFAENPSWRWRLAQRYLHRAEIAPSSQLNPEIMEAYRRKLNRFRPRAIIAYPTPLALWAEFLLASGRRYFRPRTLIVTAEALLPAQRATIERAFERPVFEHYGSREFGMIAGQCEAQTALHLHPAAAWVEYRPVAGSQGLSELLVTDLQGYGMPLIRYQINDCVAEPPPPCPCGRPFPLLPAIAGRTADVFHLPDGSVVPGISFNGRILKVCPQVVQMQVVQETLHQFRFRYVAGPDFGQGGVEAIQAGIARFFPPGLNWTLERVEAIPREASGKTRFCISHVRATPAGSSRLPS